MNIAVFGLGFVGLTTALGFADKGFTVRGFDINETRCGEIAACRVPFHEPGLDDALVRNLNKTFTLVNSAIDAVKDCDICFMCVGTPGTPDGGADLTYLYAAIDSIVAKVSPECVFVVKSTVPPGTTSTKVEPYVRGLGYSNSVAANPEFLREGYCWEDFVYPDRVVCGINDEHSEKLLAEIYAPFGAPVEFVEPNTAEFIKYLSNSLLATMISYANEMALLADTVGDINVAKAFRTLHTDKRLAGSGIASYIYPGAGYGGYCLPKDTEALSFLANSHGLTTEMLDSGIKMNHSMPKRWADKIATIVSDTDVSIGILGLSFKPGSDDVRDSPSAKIIKELMTMGYKNFYAYDPLANKEFADLFDLDINYCNSITEVCANAKAVALITAWEEFKAVDTEYPENQFIDCRYYLGRS